MSLPPTAPSSHCTHHPESPATQACDRCGRPFCSDCLVPLRGQTVCAVCKHAALSADFRSHNIYVATPPPGAATIPMPPGAAPTPPVEVPGDAAVPGASPPPPMGAYTVPAPSPSLPVQSNCSLHDGQPAVALCERCGDFICLLCLTPFEGRSYCVRCFELLWGRGELDPRHKRRKFFADPGAALGAAVITWATCFIPFVSAAPAIGALVIAGIAIGKHGKDLTRREWVTAISAIVLALGGLGFAMWIWVRIFQ